MFAIDAGPEHGYWTLRAPLLTTFMLIYDSGVSMLEGCQRATKPEYADDIASTSAFVPWFPRRVREGAV